MVFAKKNAGVFDRGAYPHLADVAGERHLSFGLCFSFSGNILNALLVSETVENHAMAHTLPYPGHDPGDETLLHLPLIPAAAGPRLHIEISQWKNPSSADQRLTWYLLVVGNH